MTAPMPGREKKVTQATIDEEMAQFMAVTGAKQIEGR